MRLVVWEKLTRSDEYRQLCFQVLNPRIEDGLSAHMKKYNTLVEKYGVPVPLHPDEKWEVIATHKDSWKWFMSHSLELMDYPTISKPFRKKVARRLSKRLPHLKDALEELPKMASKRFSYKTWENGYKAWDLIEDKGFTVEDAALILGKSPQTVYRWHNDIGKHVLGDSFEGKERKREDSVRYNGSESRYAYIERRALEERNWQTFPRPEQMRLHAQYLEANGVTTCPVKVARGAMPKPKAVNREPLEYRATTGGFTLIMKEWRLRLELKIDLEKIRIIRNCLKALGIIPSECRGGCLLCQIDDIWVLVDSEHFRATLERLGIKHRWLEIEGAFKTPMNTPHLYENYLFKEGKCFFYDP